MLLRQTGGAAKVLLMDDFVFHGFTGELLLTREENKKVDVVLANTIMTLCADTSIIWTDAHIERLVELLSHKKTKVRGASPCTFVHVEIAPLNISRCPTTYLGTRAHCVRRHQNACSWSRHAVPHEAGTRVADGCAAQDCDPHHT